MTCKVLPQSASCLPLHLYFLLPMCNIPHTLFILNHSWYPKNFILFFYSIPLWGLFTYLEMLFAFIFFPPNLLCLLLLWKPPPKVLWKAGFRVKYPTSRRTSYGPSRVWRTKGITTVTIYLYYSIITLHYNYYLYISLPYYNFYLIQLLNTQLLPCSISHSGCSISVCGMNK